MIYRPGINQEHTSEFFVPKLMSKLDMACWKTQCCMQRGGHMATVKLNLYFVKSTLCT